MNARSGRAAVRTAAASVMNDDGSMERRFRLVRPMSRETIAAAALAASHWAEADDATFRTAWETEVADVPEFTTSTIHLVTGLLLPVWRRLPPDNARVYRMQTDDGERIIGRVLKAAETDAFCANAGVDAPEVAAGDAWAQVNEGAVTVHLADGLELRRVRVMNEPRIELTGFTAGQVDVLKARGLFSEIISWKLRLFVPGAASMPDAASRPGSAVTVAEGIETALALKVVMPRMPVVAALSAGHLGAIVLPGSVRRVHVALDNDRAGRNAFERLRARHHGTGPAIHALEPCGEDFNADLVSLGPDRLRDRIARQLGHEDIRRFIGG